MSKPIIKVENLSKQYSLGVKERTNDTFREALVSSMNDLFKRSRYNGESAETIWALKDVNFEVMPGEVIGIIGHNGAGKSTLLKLLSRITEPTTGRIMLYGKVASLLEVGTGFHPELTGRENIFLNGSILGMSRKDIERNFDDIVSFSEVEKFIDTPVKRYSSGMYVRLAFAVAAHLDPNILIVDEVLAVGDAAFQRKCIGKMGEVATAGRTVLFVSHNMQAVEQLCGRAILFEQGQIKSGGETHKVVEQYLQTLRPTLRGEYNDEGSAGNEPVHLRQVSLLNVERQTTELLRFGEPFSFRLIWQHGDSIDDLCYTIRVFNGHGNMVFAANTLQSPYLNLDEAGVKSVTCSFDTNPLIPGEYRVEVAAWIRPHTKLVSIENCLGFAVSDVPYDTEYRFNIAGQPAISLRSNWLAEN